MYTNLLRGLSQFVAAVLNKARGRTINPILDNHLRVDKRGSMWVPLNPLSEQMPHQWGKSGYFFILGNDNWIEVWRVENWNAHLINISPWDDSSAW